jgi:hypothetical protein
MSAFETELDFEVVTEPWNELGDGMILKIRRRFYAGNG